jgi:hypothetical protein
MRAFYIKSAALVMLLVMALGLGCSRSVPPPSPLTEQELPGAIEKAFATGKQPEAMDLSSQVVSAFQAKDYTKAFWAIQTLASVPGLTKDQANVAARASLTINSLLQAAQAQGDAKATQTLKRYLETK